MALTLVVFFRGQNLDEGLMAQLKTACTAEKFGLLVHRKITSVLKIAAILEKRTEAPTAVLVNADSFDPEQIKKLRGILERKFPRLQFLGFTQTEERAKQVDGYCDRIFVVERPAFRIFGLDDVLAEIKRNEK